MNFINRAVKHVTRRKTKSILVALTFFIVGNLVIIGLGINMAAANAKSLTRQKMRPVISYELDYETFWNKYDSLDSADEKEALLKSIPQVKYEDVLKLSQHPDVVDLNYIHTFYGYKNGFEVVKEKEDDSSSEGGMMVSTSGGGGMPDLKIKASIFPNYLEFNDGSYELTSGRMFTQEDIDQANSVVLLEERFAELNGLRVGDTIKVRLTSEEEYELYKDWMTEEDQFIELEVIGIYKDTRGSDPNSTAAQFGLDFESTHNTLLVPTTAIAEAYLPVSKAMDEWNSRNIAGYIAEDIDEETMYDGGAAVFQLSDPTKIEQFIQENESLTSEFIKFNANNDVFEQLSKPLDTISLFSNIIVMAVIIVGIIIISLVTALSLKSRQYEIGVLLSMGVDKIKIVGQLFVELLIIGLIGFTLATFTGSIISKSVGNAVLEYQLSNEKPTNQSNSGMSVSIGGGETYFTDISQEELLAEYEVSINPALIGIVYAVGIGVVFLAILIPASSVMRFNPKKILTNIE